MLTYFCFTLLVFYIHVISHFTLFLLDENMLRLMLHAHKRKECIPGVFVKMVWYDVTPSLVNLSYIDFRQLIGAPQTVLEKHKFVHRQEQPADVVHIIWETGASCNKNNTFKDCGWASQLIETCSYQSASTYLPQLIGA